MSVKRFDSGEFSSPTRTNNGYLRCDAKITRTGVFTYKLADGTERRELRLPDEVFKGDALTSFEDVPLTNNHPREKLNEKNTGRFQTGNIKNVRRHDDHVAAKVLITDADTINDVENGKTQLSCGYNCDLEPVDGGVTRGIPGVEDGLRFDAIQRNIVGNHVAVVNVARAGETASLHLDADDAIMIAKEVVKKPKAGANPGPGVKKMKFKIDGIDYEMDDQQAQAVGKLGVRLDNAEKEAEKAKSETVKAIARADKADEDLKALQEKYNQDTSAETVAKKVADRVSLETTAAKVLKDEEIKLDSMSDDEIKKAVILKVSPDAKEKVEKADEAYVSARFDAAIEAHDAAEAKKPTASDKVKAATVSGGQHRDSATARAEMIEANRKMATEMPSFIQK
jgi:hypothetical protein